MQMEEKYYKPEETAVTYLVPYLIKTDDGEIKNQSTGISITALDSIDLAIEAMIINYENTLDAASKATFRTECKDKKIRERMKKILPEIPGEITYWHIEQMLDICKSCLVVARSKGGGKYTSRPKTRSRSKSKIRTRSRTKHRSKSRKSKK